MKILIEILCQKLIVSTIILAFLDYLKPKFLLSANHGDQHRAPPKTSESAPVIANILRKSFETDDILEILKEGILTPLQNLQRKPRKERRKRIV